jgi:hypothetical protein
MKTILGRWAAVLPVTTAASLVVPTGMPCAQETTHFEEGDLPEQPDTMATRDGGPGARVEDSLDRAGEATHRGVEHGAEPVGRGLENAMDATARGLRNAIEKTGDALRRAGDALGGQSEDE